MKVVSTAAAGLGALLLLSACGGGSEGGSGESSDQSAEEAAAFAEESPEAYERLIFDVLLGEPPLFPDHSEVEQSWKILDPFEQYWSEHRVTPEPYEPGSWGPASAHELMARDGRVWRRP